MPMKPIVPTKEAGTAAMSNSVIHMQVSVRDNNVDQALRVLKKKLQSEDVFREMKLKQHFEEPSKKKVRQQAEAIRRARKAARKRLEREGGM